MKHIWKCHLDMAPTYFKYCSFIVRSTERVVCVIPFTLFSIRICGCSQHQLVHHCSHSLIVLLRFVTPPSVIRRRHPHGIVSVGLTVPSFRIVHLADCRNTVILISHDASSSPDFQQSAFSISLTIFVKLSRSPGRSKMLDSSLSHGKEMTA